MQQTLLILLGVIVFGLYAFSQHEQSASGEQTAIQRELEAAALGVATDWSARIRLHHFDEGTTGEDVPRIQGAPGWADDLTSAGALGPEPDPATPGGERGDDWKTWDDVDDFHGFVDTVAYRVRADTAQFALSIQVAYAGPDSSGLSLVKDARIRAVYVDPQTDPDRQAFRMPVLAEVSARFANASLTIAHNERCAVAPDDCTP